MVVVKAMARTPDLCIVFIIYRETERDRESVEGERVAHRRPSSSWEHSRPQFHVVLRRLLAAIYKTPACAGMSERKKKKYKMEMGRGVFV